MPPENPTKNAFTPEGWQQRRIAQRQVTQLYDSQQWPWVSEVIALADQEAKKPQTYK